MIKIENTDVYGWEATICGMRNSFNSWDKSDSFLCDGICLTCTDTERKQCTVDGLPAFHVGDNDLKLMKKLVAAGSDHSKFMRMITVTCDIIAPLYWWKEFDTYKVGTVRNSCSTMHKIADKKFTLDDFSHEHLSESGFNNPLICVVECLNYCRTNYLKTNDKKYWWQMIQLLPSSYNQRATVQLNYAVLRNMYHARKTHKLDEWRDFCEWVETLPYSELITM